MCFDAINICRIPFYFVYCVWSLVGLLGFNLLTALFLMIFQMYFGHWVHSRNNKKHHKLGKASSKRRKYMQETVYSSKALKFYNWNEAFEKEILKWRGKEQKLRWEIEMSDIGNHIASSFLPHIQNPLICASLFYFGGTLNLADSMQLSHMLGMLNGQLHHFPHVQRQWAHLKIQLRHL
jgi:ABC-type bacteriocin/lantibiotic exporter with double-glycine peptidase domain